MIELPRGIRNRNPGNLENDGTKWEGLDTAPDGVYLRFVSAIYGIRALAIDLYEKFEKDGLQTIDAIIAKYAPPNDNDTEAYQIAVSTFVQMPRDMLLSFDKPLIPSRIIRAIIEHENGKPENVDSWYSFATLSNAMTRANKWGAVSVDDIR